MPLNTLQLFLCTLENLGILVFLNKKNKKDAHQEPQA